MKCRQLTLVFLLASFLFDPTLGEKEDDPCDFEHHGNLHDVDWRGTLCGMKDKGVCDKRLEPGWFSAKGDDDTNYRMMAEGPVDMFWCGTLNPIYLLRGSHPSVNEGIVSRTACISGVNSLCERNFTIEVKNCSAFYVYNLTKTNACASAYCFGTAKGCPKPDPCKETNRQTISIRSDRSANCQSEDLQLCDITLKSGWYRMQHDGVDSKMPNKCIAEKSCGTVHPIWLNGPEPTVNEKVADRKACVSSGNTNNCSCLREYDIQIKNCSSYLVYNLSATKYCPERYCFGDSTQCPQIARNPGSRSTSPDFMKYVYGSVAAIVITIVIAVMALLVFKHIQRSHTKVDGVHGKYDKEKQKKELYKEM